MTDPSDQDLKALWSGQEMEADPMTLEQIHALVRRYDRKTRVALWLVPAVLLVAGVLGGQAWLMHPDPLGRTGAALYLLGMIASCALIARVNFPQRDPAEPAGAYLRRRLQRQLDNVRGGWVLVLLPVVPSVVVIGYWILRNSHGAGWARLMPVAVLAAAWMLIFMVRLRRGARRLKADLDELDRLMKG